MIYGAQALGFAVIFDVRKKVNLQIRNVLRANLLLVADFPVAHMNVCMYLCMNVSV